MLFARTKSLSFSTTVSLFPSSADINPLMKTKFTTIVSVLLCTYALESVAQRPLPTEDAVIDNKWLVAFGEANEIGEVPGASLYDLISANDDSWPVETSDERSPDA